MAETSPTDVHAIGLRLIELREAMGRSQADFARLCGVSPQALLNWEKGNNRPSIDGAYKIAAGTGGVPVGYILSGDTRGMPHEIMERLQAHRRRHQRGASTAG
jgi:transcriptional regulator with XRE-family HTH domain